VVQIECRRGRLGGGGDGNCSWLLLLLLFPPAAVAVVGAAGGVAAGAGAGGAGGAVVAVGDTPSRLLLLRLRARCAANIPEFLSLGRHSQLKKKKLVNFPLKH